MCQTHSYISENIAKGFFTTLNKLDTNSFTRSNQSNYEEIIFNSYRVYQTSEHRGKLNKYVTENRDIYLLNQTKY